MTVAESAFRADFGCTAAGEEGAGVADPVAWPSAEVVVGSLEGEVAVDPVAVDPDSDCSGVTVGVGASVLLGVTVGGEVVVAEAPSGASEAALSTSPSMTSSRTR
jgi:hypothetical protein